ncbi:MAG: hypothetical protein K6G00_09805 [Treponema sp.]|nr:hypothetical protein [Treponema sp.]
MTEEMNAIQHLLEVEADASQLVNEAQNKADVRISEARAQAETEFKKIYAEFACELESHEQAERESIDKEQEVLFNDYVQSLDSTPKDKESFNGLLEKILFA